MTENTSHDIDDILLEQQEHDQDFNSEFEAGGNGNGNGHDDKKEEFETPIAEKEDQYEDEDKDGDASDRNAKIPSAADVLVELATQSAKLLFKDQYGTAYAQVDTTGHDEIIKVEGSKFKRFLARLFYDRVRKKVVNAESITNAIQVIQAKAEYEGQTIPLALRVAWNNGDIYYDMSNEEWQCIKITEHNWEMANTPGPMFIRYNQTSQTKPDRNYEPDIFDRFLQLTNLKED